MATNDRESPTSFRFGKGRDERFRAFQAARKLSQSEAIHHLLDLGLEKEGFGVPSKDPKKKERWAV